ncbi:MAG: hypothetical protein LUG16_01130 [Candidatus Gastranaerophilales bacterium]|nr:hypothetical protein [Candidatus Gastranaerophilales bacterium]
MTEENLELIKNAGLGVNAYDKTPAPQPDENDTESYFGKPEKYDYSDVELPENYCYNEDLLNEFNELAGKYNLSQKSANELMSMAVKLTQQMSSNFSKTMAEQQRQKIENYRHNLVNDFEMGGAGLAKTLRTANIAYTEFADDDVQTLLNQAGLNCHPKIVKMFYNIGRQMQNDVIHSANMPAVPKESREDILFPTMQ